MNHDTAAPGQFGARPNRRASAQLTIDQEGRKPLFSKPSRETLNPRDTAPAASATTNRYGFSPTNARPPSRAAGIPRPPSSASMRPPSRAAAAAIPRPSSSMSQTPSVGSNHSADVVSPGSRLPRPKSTIGVFAKGKIPSVADVWALAGEEDRPSPSPLERTRRTSPAVDASPSPAPRPFHNRQVAEEAKVRQNLNKEPNDFGRARPLSRLSSDSLRDSYVARYGGYSGSPASQSGSSSGSFTRRLSQYEREMAESPSAARQPENLFGNTRVGPYIADTGRTLARKTSNSSLNGGSGLGRRTSNSSLNGGQTLGKRTSNSSLNGTSPNLGRKTSYGSLGSSPGARAFAKSSVPEGWIKHLLDEDDKGIKRTPKPDWEVAANTPLPSVEALEPTPPTSRPGSTNPEARSPEKSFAWQLDADFTAGDLQISDSPRIRISGSGYDDASNRRFSNGSAYAEEPESSPFRREASAGPLSSRAARTNSKIDEIRQREEKANEQLAELRRSQSKGRNTRLEEIREREAEVEEELAKTKAQTRSYYPTPDEDDLAPPVREYPRPKNSKLDTIRAREAESVSKKALAESRLEEIRERNSMSREFSPEAERVDKESTPVRESKREAWQPTKQDEGEHIANTPVTIYKNAGAPRETKPEAKVASPKSPGRPQLQHTRTDSRDLLQRLARAASSSPAGSPAPETVKPQAATDEKTEKDTQPPNTIKHAEERPTSRTVNPARTIERLREGFAEDIERNSEDRLAGREPKEAIKKVAAEPLAKEKQTTEVVEEKETKDQPSAETTPVEEVPKKTEDLKKAEEPARKPYVPRRRSEDRPKTSDSEKAEVTRRNRNDTLKKLEPTPKSDEASSSSKDEPKTIEAERPVSAGLRRVRRQRSTESSKDSRKSMASSDGDPTDRIEQEIMLFAPTDGQSERGSTRPPSIEPDSEEDKDLLAEETPRPVKTDPLSLPTPKVTGAYVDSPATVRVDKVQEKELKSAIKSEARPSTSHGRASSRRNSRASLRGRSISNADASESESSEQKEQDTAGTTTTSVLRRRKSTSRPRRPLMNSVKPPTVKDDLLELQRRHQIEDSTLDDLEEMFNLQKPLPPDFETEETVESMLDEINEKREEIANSANLSSDERDHTMQQIDRMTKTLTDGLRSIRSAKQGIERLEDKVSHADPTYNENKISEMEKMIAKVQDQQAKGTAFQQPTATQKTADHTGISSDEKVNVIQLPIPQLMHRNPLRITFLGLLVIISAVWYAAESAMCEIYCRPTTCSSTPCVWSATDPTWGYAIPVKIDEWTTNGWGRQVANQLAEDASDLLADLEDYLTGTDIATIDIRTLDFWEKRQLRRRLRKKGLVKRPEESPEDKARWDAWHEARVARERVQDAREMGYDISDEEESMGGDERV
ncbi:hypothetical protein N0V92_005896 [Colletotrichum tropicale]|nr:hypothetical protein N0V92_005896 [Colletotrichum tropicale]